MKQQPFYPDIRQPRWATACRTSAVAGLGYYLLVYLSLVLVHRMELTFFVLIYLAPTFFVVGLLEGLILLITLQSWRRWQNPRQRTITLVCSGVFLLLFVMQIRARL